MREAILKALLNAPNGLTVTDLAQTMRKKIDVLTPELHAMAEDQQVYYTPHFETWHHPATCKTVCKTEHSAGGDCTATQDYRILPGESMMIESFGEIPPGMPDDSFLMAVARSSLWGKKRLVLANGVGIIDADYPNRVFFEYINKSRDIQVIKKGEAVGQLVCIEFLRVWPTKIAKRTGGHGSTDDEA